MEAISQEAADSAQKYLIFTILDRRYALPSKIISEVAALEKVFPLPLVPPFVRGIINRYSIPYALIDVSLLLCDEGARETTAMSAMSAMTAMSEASAMSEVSAVSGGKVIVFKEETDRLALLIDDVVDFADLPPGAFMEVDPESGSDANLVRAFFEWKGNQVFYLESDELMRQIQQDFSQREL